MRKPDDKRLAAAMMSKIRHDALKREATLMKEEGNRG